MAQVIYAVDLIDEAWTVSLMGKPFGPYSTLDAAVRAASNAAHKAEAQGYDAVLTINTPPEPMRDGHAADAAQEGTAGALPGGEDDRAAGS
ncbi:MAG TPA: hypothetical protein VF474_04220 [Phenylobacterium sp.]